MRRIVLILLLTVMSNIIAYSAEPKGIVPLPAEMKWRSSEFVITFDTKVVLSEATKTMGYVSAELNRVLTPLMGSELKVVTADKPIKKSINMWIDSSLGKEEYTLDVNSSRIIIKGGTEQALFYGVQTLRQILTKDKKSVVVNGISVKDKPSFTYRGQHLDVGRHFFGTEDIKKFIDILALHKINNFHWHLTEDQGWRIEIKRYPELTRIGAYRDSTLITHKRDPIHLHKYEVKRYGGFYTQDEVREIVQYATERFMNVIPEIEMPGHAVAALASFPEVGCSGKGYHTETKWGVFKDVYCAGKEETFTFLENVLTEIMELFPSPYIHLGADECPKDSWKVCPACQARIKKEGLKDEFELQSYFMKRMTKFVNSKGRSVIGWDELQEGGGMTESTILHVRRPAAKEALKKGNRVILSPSKFFYFNFYQTSNKQAEPLAHGGDLPVEMVYGFDPLAQFGAEYRSQILGMQGNLWTEYIRTFDYAQYMLLPRLAASCELSWSYDNTKRDMEDFRARMNNMRKLYDALGYNYATHMFKN